MLLAVGSTCYIEVQNSRDAYVRLLYRLVAELQTKGIRNSGRFRQVVTFYNKLGDISFIEATYFFGIFILRIVFLGRFLSSFNVIQFMEEKHYAL
jgi:hypothetical protein